MCLEHVHETPLERKEAYKIFSLDSKFPLSGIFYDFPFKKRRWLKDSNDEEFKLGYCGKFYPAGFHCFLYKDHALAHRDRGPSEVVHRVLLKDIVASGYQSTDTSSLSIVARQIYIMEEVLP